MKKLIKNITSIYGEQGNQWIKDLPGIIEALSQHWQLSNISHVANMTYNYVAKATTNTNQPVILKISCDKASIDNEKNALLYFDGNATVKLLDYNDKYHAMLLKQAIPGVSLKLLYPAEIEYVMDSYAYITKTLHSRPLPNQYSYRHIRDWLQAIDNISRDQFPVGMLDQAITLKNQLLATISHEVFLHGDLHQDNIIKNNNDWLAIDPKGIVGDPEFEMAAFDFIHADEFHLTTEIKSLFNERIELLANKSKLNAARIRNWVFVRLVLSAVWSIEDNTDIGWDIELAKYFVK
jgi:streptomycin 6-kinase